MSLQANPWLDQASSNTVIDLVDIPTSPIYSLIRWLTVCGTVVLSISFGRRMASTLKTCVLIIDTVLVLRHRHPTRRRGFFSILNLDINLKRRAQSHGGLAKQVCGHYEYVLRTVVHSHSVLNWTVPTNISFGFVVVRHDESSVQVILVTTP
ncbi:hypothetical protein ABKN59_006896 [Abortiporus biennis]